LRLATLRSRWSIDLAHQLLYLIAKIVPAATGSFYVADAVGPLLHDLLNPLVQGIVLEFERLLKFSEALDCRIQDLIRRLLVDSVTSSVD